MDMVPERMNARQSTPSAACGVLPDSTFTATVSASAPAPMATMKKQGAIR